jgi:hypothetical protein
MIEEKLDTMIDLLRQLVGMKEVPAKPGRKAKEDAPAMLPLPVAYPAGPTIAPGSNPFEQPAPVLTAAPPANLVSPPSRVELSKALGDKIINNPKFGGAGKGGEQALKLIDAFRPEGSEAGLAGVPVTSYADLMNAINIAAAV